MKAQNEFVLAVSGFKPGLREFDFLVDDSFFHQFENAPIQKANVKVHLYFDKRPSFMELTFEFEGTVHVDCDRCLEFFDLPIKGNSSLLVKTGEENADSDDENVLFISKNDTELNLSKPVYDMVLLAIPMSKKHEDAGGKCDENITKYLDQYIIPEEKPKDGKSPWDILKDFGKN